MFIMGPQGDLASSMVYKEPDYNVCVPYGLSPYHSRGAPARLYVLQRS
jgi:hypothetical protein